jgi:hypothetical protein
MKCQHFRLAAFISIVFAAFLFGLLLLNLDTFFRPSTKDDSSYKRYLSGLVLYREQLQLKIKTQEEDYSKIEPMDDIIKKRKFFLDVIISGDRILYLADRSSYNEKNHVVLGDGSIAAIPEELFQEIWAQGISGVSNCLNRQGVGRVSESTGSALEY